MFYQIRLILSACLFVAAVQAQAPPPTVRIPAGPFLMGSDEGAIWEKPVHEVYVSEFEISKRPVTLSEYRAFRPSHPEQAGLAANADAASSPVTGVSWEDAQAYCQWLTTRTGRRYRLPTEAEWEKAVRGGIEGAKYPWGDDPPVPEDKVSDAAYRIPERANAWGIVAGVHNLWEWVADGYSADYYRDSPAHDPRGPENMRYRVLRGGGYRSDPNSMRCANRGSARPGMAADVITFRVARGDGPAPPSVSEAAPAPEPVPAAQPARTQTPAAAPTPAPAPAPKRAIATAFGDAVSVSAISVETGSSQVTITIHTSRQPEYKTMALSGPDRLVIDIVGGTMRAPRAQQRIDVAALGVSRVRSAQFQNSPAIARIVVDMDAKLDSDIAVEDNSLIVRLRPKQ